MVERLKSKRLQLISRSEIVDKPAGNETIGMDGQLTQIAYRMHIAPNIRSRNLSEFKEN